MIGEEWRGEIVRRGFGYVSEIGKHLTKLCVEVICQQLGHMLILPEHPDQSECDGQRAFERCHKIGKVLCT
jgi:hypothetical protein